MEHLPALLKGLALAVIVAGVIFFVAWKWILYHPTPEEQVRIDQYYKNLHDHYERLNDQAWKLDNKANKLGKRWRFFS